jgi:DNA-binding protein H-NS
MVALSDSQEHYMARPSKLTSMSVEALLQLRDDIGAVLTRKAGQLQTQLAALGNGGWVSSAKNAVGRPRGSKMKGRKVPPKYRNPKDRSETWAGRGAMPRWMAAEIKKGKKREDFAIDKTAARAKRAPVKRAKRTKKTAAAPKSEANSAAT